MMIDTMALYGCMLNFVQQGPRMRSQFSFVFLSSLIRPLAYLELQKRGTPLIGHLS